MTIFLADLDNNILDAIVKAEVEDRFDRLDIVTEMIFDTFHTIAGEGVYLENSDQYEELVDMACEAACDWVDYFGSRGERHAVLFRMFPKATEIINQIEVYEEPEEFYTGDNERTLYNGGIFNPDILNHIKSHYNKVSIDPALRKQIQDMIDQWAGNP